MSGKSQLTSPYRQQHGGESGSRPALPTDPPQGSVDEDALSSNTCARTHEPASALEPMPLPACVGTTFDVPGVPPPSLPSSEPCRDHASRYRPMRDGGDTRSALTQAQAWEFMQAPQGKPRSKITSSTTTRNEHPRHPSSLHTTTEHSQDLLHDLVARVQGHTTHSAVCTLQCRLKQGKSQSTQH